jgi:hypothetical protein
MTWTPFLLLLAYSTVRGCNSTSELYNESYAACILLPQCRDSFFLSVSAPPWEKVRFFNALDFILDKLYPTDYVSICNSPASFDVWLGLLSNWRICRRNEFFSELTGDCICMNDKNCDLEMHGTLGYESFIMRVFSVLYVIAALYGMSRILNLLLLPETRDRMITGKADKEYDPIVVLKSKNNKK